jgi:hypothetical protein
MMKEDIWAAQYFAVRDEASRPWADTNDNLTAPADVPTYAIMSYNSGHNDASNKFYRDRKLEKASQLAGGNLAQPALWCTDSDCSLAFPVSKSTWTAKALIELGL